MNIFVISPDPVQCSEYLDSKRAIKMILESAQMLCTTYHCLNLDDELWEVPYRPTHLNHPCSIWARSSETNFDWLCSHAKALCHRYTREYKRVHKSEAVIDWCIKNKHWLNFSKKELTPFVNCTNITNNNTFEAYKEYLQNKWRKDKESLK